MATELVGDLFGVGPVFSVYLNELDHSASAEPIINRCRELVRLADIVLVLYDGRAGWSPADSIGICQVEFAYAMATSSTKVRVIELPVAPLPKQGPARERDIAFREEKERLRPWTHQAATADEAVDAAKAALYAAVIELARAGSRSGRGRQVSDSGDALDWKRMNYSERAEAMVSAMQVALRRAGATDAPQASAAVAGRDRMLVLPIAGRRVLVRLHAIPAAMTVPAARELVGQPFLDDHLSAPLLSDDLGGPLHLIACAGGVTESQAIRQLGYPDATIVASDFGVYIADPVQKQQLVFLSNCRDDTTTADRVETFRDWLVRTSEDTNLEARARSRSKLVRLLAAEL
jgi:hypothetical protein